MDPSQREAAPQIFRPERVTIAKGKARSEAAETREGPVDLRSAEQVSKCEPARREKYGAAETHKRSGGSFMCKAGEQSELARREPTRGKTNF